MSCGAGRSSILPPLHPQVVDDRLVGSLDTQFLEKIHSADVDPSERLSEVQSLLSSPFKITLVRSLRGDEAQRLIDSLDRVLVWSHLDEKLWQRCIRLIRKISRARKTVPSSYLLQEEYIHVREVRSEGESAVVYDGEHQGLTVAIKRFKPSKGDADRIFKRLCRETIAWKHLSHPSILPLLGVSISVDSHRFCIVTEWMSNGNLVRYARSNPTANRLQLLSEVASAVTYLHDLKIVHGDLKGANILVDKTGAALVTDFGLITMTDLSTFLSETASSSEGTYRWMSPELLDPEGFRSDGQSTRESDRYAFGMVIYEILTGLKPFHHMHGLTFIPPVVRGERPKKPSHAESLGFSETLWGLVQLCWSQTSSNRPPARVLLDHLLLASPTWVPPTEYPAVVTDVSSAIESVSSKSEDVNVACLIGTDM